MPTYTTTTSNEIEIYSGKSGRMAKQAARDNHGELNRPVIICKDGERIASYAPRAGKRGFWGG